MTESLPSLKRKKTGKFVLIAASYYRYNTDEAQNVAIISCNVKSIGLDVG